MREVQQEQDELSRRTERHDKCEAHCLEGE